MKFATEIAYKNGYKQGAKELSERLKQAICDNTYPDFNRDGKPINVWNAKTGYDLIDQITKGLLEEISNAFI